MLKIMTKSGRKVVTYLLFFAMVFSAGFVVMLQGVEASNYDLVYNYFQATPNPNRSSGNLQTWTVPYTATYTITACGGSGGSYGGKQGGKGGVIKGDFSLVKGQVITMLAGASGQDGYYYNYYSSSADYYGGGGGASVVINTTANTLLLVGGGGGGAGKNYDGGNGGASIGGTGNGGTTYSETHVVSGMHHGDDYSYTVYNYFGRSGGGYLSSGTPDTIGSYWSSASGTGRGYAQGGAGGNISPATYGGYGGGGAGYLDDGGGGGGYTGGNGGYKTTASQGGTSYNAGTNPVNTSGSNTGNGYVTISANLPVIFKDYSIPYTSGLQTWIVPDTGNYTITAYGASGGNFYNTYQYTVLAATGGKGAYTKGEFALNKGQKINIITGSVGIDAYGSFAHEAGGGGGGTFAVNASTNTPLFVAGGGGGASGGSGGDGGVSVGGTGNGGAGGQGTTGYFSRPDGGGGGGGGYLSNGQQGYYQSYNYSTRKTDTNYTGGQGGYGYAQGSYCGIATDYGSNGGYGGGGASGGGGNSYFGQSAGGGGGGGYTGGNGGSVGGSGAGGTSYNAGANPVNTPGVNTGNGYITIHAEIPAISTAPSITGLTPDKASPENTGTTITWTATATGGSSLQYQFWVNDGTGWVITQPYSSANTYTWRPNKAGSYQIGVWVKSATSTADKDDVKIVGPYTIVNPPVLTALTPDKASPENTGTTITWTATAIGGSSLQYQFWVNDGTGWVITQPYSSANTYTWTPSKAGSYQIGVWVKSATSTADKDDLKIVGPYTVNIHVTLNTPTIFGSGYYDENAQLSATGTNIADAAYRVFYTTNPTAPAISPGNNPGSGWTDSGYTKSVTVNNSASISSIIPGAILVQPWTYVTVKVWAASSTGDSAIAYTAAYSLTYRSDDVDSYIGDVAHNEITRTGAIVSTPDQITNNMDTPLMDGDMVHYRFEFNVLKASNIQDVEVTIYANIFNDPVLQLDLADPSGYVRLEKGTETPPGSGVYAYSTITDFGKLTPDGTAEGTTSGENRYTISLGNVIAQNGIGRYAIEYVGRLKVNNSLATGPNVTTALSIMRNDVQMKIYAKSNPYPNPIAQDRPNRKFYMDVKVTKMIVKYA